MSLIARSKKGRDIFEGDRHQMSYEDAEAILTIKNVTAADAGDYKCYAANKLGHVETTGPLLVHCEYDIDGLVQDCSNSSALAVELLQSCTEPSIW